MLRAPDVRTTITAAARRCGLTSRAVRFYEAQGLVNSHRGIAGARSFDRDGMERLAYIAFARRAGLSLSQIRDLLVIGRRDGASAEGARLLELMEAQMAELSQRQRHLADAIRQLAEHRRPAAA